MFYIFKWMLFHQIEFLCNVFDVIGYFVGTLISLHCRFSQIIISHISTQRASSSGTRKLGQRNTMRTLSSPCLTHLKNSSNIHNCQLAQGFFSRVIQRFLTHERQDLTSFLPHTWCGRRFPKLVNNLNLVLKQKKD